MERYTFVNKIAEGAYGTVWKCVDGAGGQVVAVKKLKEPPQTRQDAEFAMREVRLLQQISHINVVRLIEAYQSVSGRLYLVFEYVDATVLQLLKSCAPQQGLPIKQVQSIIWQVAQALVYLHKNKIIHRDIKPSNILINESGIVKLCDFGFARPFAMGSDTVAQYTTYVVTRWYRPPEVLVGDTYGPAVDVWALGCIFVELVTGRPLFPGQTQHDQLYLVLKAVGNLTDRQMKVMKLDSQYKCFKPPSKQELVSLEALLPGFSPPMMELLRACLQPDAAKRITAEKLLHLSFFNGVQDVLPPACKVAIPAGDALPDDITHKLQSLKAAQQQQAAPAAAAAAAAEHMQQAAPAVSAAAGTHDAVVTTVAAGAAAVQVPSQGPGAPYNKSSPQVPRTRASDTHVPNTVPGHPQHLQANVKDVSHTDIAHGSSQQQQATAHRQSGNLPPGLPVPKQPAGGSASRVSQHGRNPSGGVPSDDAFLQDHAMHANQAHTGATVAPAGHMSSSSAAVSGMQSGIRLGALHQSFAANRNRDAVDAAKRQTWHGEPDGMGGRDGLGLVGTKSGIQATLQSANSIPHGALSSSTRAPTTAHSQPSTAEYPATAGQNSSTLPPRSSKGDGRTMRRSNTYAGRDNTGPHMVSPSGTNSSQCSHAATPSHHTEDGSHATASTGVGSSDLCTIVDHLHGANADTSSTSPDMDLHSPNSTVRSPMAARKAATADVVGHVQREWQKAHTHIPCGYAPGMSTLRSEGEEEDEGHVNRDQLHRQASKGYLADRSVHWAPAAHQHPFMHVSTGTVADESARRTSDGGMHSLSRHTSESGYASNNMQGSAVAFAAAHALDKASQRLTKAAKLINKLPPSANTVTAASGQGALTSRISNSSVPAAPTGGVHLSLPTGSNSSNKLGQCTPRVSHGAVAMPQDASSGPLPRYSLNGPAVPGALNAQTLCLPSLANKDGARAGQITPITERSTSSGLTGDKGAYHTADGHSLPVIASSRKITSGKPLASKQDSISSGLGVSEYRINKGVAAVGAGL